MDVKIYPGKAAGTVAAPPSKSMAHRLLICAGLAEGTSRISGLGYNEDILATLDCLQAMGVQCDVRGDTVTVIGTDLRNAVPGQALNCRESGSTMRFFLPLALLSGNPAELTGTEKLLSRPMGVYRQLCLEKGIRYEQSLQMLQVQGKLESGVFRLPGNISSQFISGLLFALPLLHGDSYIQITTPLESKSYVQLTICAMEKFGVHVFWQDEQTLFVPGGQCYRPCNEQVEGDYSAAAFYEAMNVLGSDVTVTGLAPDSLQGDRVCGAYLKILCAGYGKIDLSDCPDLGPLLFAVAAAKHGGYFTGTARLRLKESDRVAAMARELAAFGVAVTVEDNAVTVHPGNFHAPERDLEGYNDHRIVMALAVLLMNTGGQIHGAQAVRKSYPDFFEQLTQLGIKASVIDEE